MDSPNRAPTWPQDSPKAVSNQRASALIAKSERYASGYWVLKMFFWRAEEYDRAVSARKRARAGD